MSDFDTPSVADVQAIPSTESTPTESAFCAHEFASLTQALAATGHLPEVVSGALAHAGICFGGYPHQELTRSDVLALIERHHVETTVTGA